MLFNCCKKAAVRIRWTPRGLYYLGASHLQLKQKPQATEALERALAAGLQEPFASEAKRLLAEAKTQ